MPIQFEFREFTALRRALKGYTKGPLVAMLHQQMNMTVIDAINIARNLAPVDTGRLRRSIGEGMRVGLDREFIADTNYAEFVEFGTERHEPQPYMRPAAEKAIKVAAPRIKQAIENQLLVLAGT